MKLKLVKKWWEGYYPYCDNEQYREAIEEVRQAIKDRGITSVKKSLSWFDIAICKLYTGEYEFTVNCAEVYIDFKKTFITNEQYYSTQVKGYYFSPISYKSRTLLVTKEQQHYNNIPLSLIIEFGEECEDCGVVFLSEESAICSSCIAANQALSYDTRAEDILGFEEIPKKKNLLGKTETSDTFFGIELEYEKVTARQVKQHLSGHAIAKRDGSIRNGVEVVTRPACIKTHKVSLKPFYDQIKVKAESNTGMHVHVDKSKLSQYQIGFMLQFLNDGSLIKDIEKVAGRKYSSNSYCKTKVGTLMTTGIFYDEYDKRLKRAETDKYSPLNTRKKNTIEVRIFSSPESHEEMSAKLDFVNALVKYSSPYAVSVKRLADKFKWETFIGFVQANKKDFPDFVSFYLKGE